MSITATVTFCINCTYLYSEKSVVRKVLCVWVYALCINGHSLYKQLCSMYVCPLLLWWICFVVLWGCFPAFATYSVYTYVCTCTYNGRYTSFLVLKKFYKHSNVFTTQHFSHYNYTCIYTYFVYIHVHVYSHIVRTYIGKDISFLVNTKSSVVLYVFSKHSIVLTHTTLFHYIHVLIIYVYMYIHVHVDIHVRTSRGM